MTVNTNNRNTAIGAAIKHKEVMTAQDAPECACQHVSPLYSSALTPS